MIVNIGPSPVLLIGQEKEGKQLVFYGPDGGNKFILKFYPLCYTTSRRQLSGENKFKDSKESIQWGPREVVPLHLEQSQRIQAYFCSFKDNTGGFTQGVAAYRILGLKCSHCMSCLKHQNA